VFNQYTGFKWYTNLLILLVFTCLIGYGLVRYINRRRRVSSRKITPMVIAALVAVGALGVLSGVVISYPFSMERYDVRIAEDEAAIQADASTTTTELPKPDKNTDPSWTVHAVAYGKKATSPVFKASLRVVGRYPGDVKGTTRVKVKLCAAKNFELDPGSLETVQPYGFDLVNTLEPVVDISTHRPVKVMQRQKDWGGDYLAKVLPAGKCDTINITLLDEHSRRTYLVFRSMDGEVRQGVALAPGMQTGTFKQ